MSGIWWVVGDDLSCVVLRVLQHCTALHGSPATPRVPACPVRPTCTARSARPACVIPGLTCAHFSA